VKVILSKFGKFWRMVTEDSKDGTVERVFVPSALLTFLLHYLRSGKDKEK
jgi:hypothetical protein